MPLDLVQPHVAHHKNCNILPGLVIVGDFNAAG